MGAHVCLRARLDFVPGGRIRVVVFAPMGLVPERVEGMYGKVFDQIFDGTLHGHVEAAAVLMAMIAIADPDGVVDLTLTALTRRTGWPADFVERGVKELEQPDPDSRTPDEDGRRVVRLRENTSWGWRIVNYLKYRNIRDESGRREYMRKYMQEYRRKQSVNSVSDGKPPLAHAEEEEDSKNILADSPPKPISVPRGAPISDEQFLEFKLAYPQRDGDYRWKQARGAINARIREGHTFEEILAGTKRYAAHCKANGKIGTEYVKQASSFIGAKDEKPFLLAWSVQSGPDRHGSDGRPKVVV